MDTSLHTLQTLFCQLGLPSDPEQIAAFVESHRPLGDTIPLTGANFWNEVQATFLAEAKADDSDWCESVDRLDSLLREK
ncbi:MAG: DUF2789 domain-containing protein [Methylococcaceae bacterium]|nr:DUF2789 domain-containing protein [Methylococcaceae bacterium]